MHLFVTAIADGKMTQDAMVPKTWSFVFQCLVWVWVWVWVWVRFWVLCVCSDVGLGVGVVCGRAGAGTHTTAARTPAPRARSLEWCMHTHMRSKKQALWQ